jgi:hypothetical protein
MTVLINTPTAHPDAHAPAQTQARSKAKFHRILVRRDDETKHTSVSVSERCYADMLRFASGGVEEVNGVLRRAAVRVKGETRGQFSHLVRLKALSMLRGAYRPQAYDATHRLAEANNSVWAANS